MDKKTGELKLREKESEGERAEMVNTRLKGELYRKIQKKIIYAFVKVQRNTKKRERKEINEMC